jgi:hypothetical protein
MRYAATNPLISPVEGEDVSFAAAGPRPLGGVDCKVRHHQKLGDRWVQRRALTEKTVDSRVTDLLLKTFEGGAASGSKIFSSEVDSKPQDGRQPSKLSLSHSIYILPMFCLLLLVLLHMRTMNIAHTHIAGYLFSSNFID